MVINFLNRPLKNGANYSVVSQKNKKNLKLIMVKNTMTFLKKLAKKSENYLLVDLLL